MITLNVRNKKYKMPSKLSEIPLEEGIQIMEQIGFKEPDLQVKTSIIGMLSKIDVDILQHFEPDSIEEIYSKLEISEKQVVSLRFLKTFKLNGIEYGMMDLNNPTVEEWGDLEFWMSEGEFPFTHLGELLSVMFRPVNVKYKTLKNILLNGYGFLRYRKIIPMSFKSYELEDIKDEHLKNGDTFMTDLDFNFGYAAFNHVLNVKENLRKEYKILFKTDEQIDAQKNDPFREDEIKDAKDFGDWWGFYHLVSECSENLFERDAWFNKPLREFYKYLSYNKQKQYYNGKQ